MATKEKKQYLLVLAGPVNSFPVGLYDSWEDALEAAVKHGIPDDGTALPTECNGDPDAQDLNAAEGNGPFSYETFGVDYNKRPVGFVVVEFTNGEVSGHSWIMPTNHRDIVFPGEGKDGPLKIDPDQTLNF
jgi:hypothetical protein